MTVNDVLVRYNFITNVSLKSDSAELSKKTKVKVMGMRIEMGKVKADFDNDLQTFANSAVTDDMRTLANKEDKTPEEETQVAEMNAKLNDEYQAYIAERSAEEVEIKKSTFTEDEYNEIIDVCSGNDVEINENKLSPEVFLEIFYKLFVTNE